MPALLGVPVKSRDRIVVTGPVDVELDYFVNGVRRGFSEHEPYAPNKSLRPEVRNVPFGAQYPEDLRDILVQNGTLNADYTPNEAPAARLGWELENPDEVPVHRRFWLTNEERNRLLRSESRR